MLQIENEKLETKTMHDFRTHNRHTGIENDFLLTTHADQTTSTR